MSTLVWNIKMKIHKRCQKMKLEVSPILVENSSPSFRPSDLKCILILCILNCMSLEIRSTSDNIRNFGDLKIFP